MNQPTVCIDYLPESVDKYVAHDSHQQALVCIDIFRATTTAITALSLGRKVYPVATTDEAFELAKILGNPLLAGEQGGNIPYGFDLTNSPVQIVALHAIPSGNYTHPDREIILLSSSGTRLIKNAARCAHVYLACLRNLSTMAAYLASHYQQVVIIGAGTRGVFRREDQMACAWLAEKLLAYGFIGKDAQTSDYIHQWSKINLDKVRYGRSADYLIRSGQVHDMEFTLHHIDDLKLVVSYQAGQLQIITTS